MPKTLIPLALLFASLAVQVNPSSAAAADQPANQEGASGPALNPVVQWNRALLVIVRTAGAQPATVHPTRSFAMMHAAIYDAVNAIDRTHRPYRVRLPRASRDASQEAAAAAAAHRVLASLYPTFQAMLEIELQTSLKPIPEGQARTDGIAIGEAVGDRIIALRSGDQSDAQPIPYVFGTQPGDYQSTPPNFPPQPQFTHWSFVTPFALNRANRFRPIPPPALASNHYADDFNEVKTIGIMDSTIRTPDQSEIGRFWNGPIQNYWNEIAQSASLARQLTTAQAARVFALLDIALADGVIAFYDAKYTYNFWRPVTAVRAADPDINPLTMPDPNWLPQSTNTAPDPSYPGAHAVLSAVGATMLSFALDSDDIDLTVTSEVLPDVERSFHSFSAAGQEATLSRVYAGQHFRFDETAGTHLGERVADFVAERFLLPRHRESGNDSE